MDEHRFAEDGRPVWTRLTQLVADARVRGAARLGAERIRGMYEDYRRTAADLAYAQTHFPDSATTTYLNRLVAAAHGELYQSRPRRAAGAWRFVAYEVPILIRSCARPILVATALLVGAAALGFLLAHTDYSLARLFLPEQFRDTVADSLERDNTTMSVGALAPLFAAGITVNNIQVALTAFAGGLTAGALTVYALVSNGMLVGVLAGVFAKAGASLTFWSLIAPHGTLELPAICIAAGAGLHLGGALLRPGDVPRLTALRLRAPVAMRLLLGTVPLFIVAGLIEGFITPLDVDPVLKLAFGALMALLLAAYIRFPGRGATASETPTPS